jgi:ribosomal protein L4
MKNIRIFLKPVGLFLAVFMVILSGPYQSATAALIGTESVINTDRAQNAREYLKSLLARQDVRNALVSQGIDPGEAKNRIDSLTDEEATLVADQLQELPAGGDFFTTLLIVALIVFLVLLITDITGYTDIFPFVKSNK